MEAPKVSSDIREMEGGKMEWLKPCHHHSCYQRGGAERTRLPPVDLVLASLTFPEGLRIAPPASLAELLPILEPEPCSEEEEEEDEKEGRKDAEG